MSITSWTVGDSSGSETLTADDHVYSVHWNEIRTAINALETILDPDTSLLTSPVISSLQINDASADHQYIFAVSELTADRTVTLPLLTGNDEFVFKDHTQTLTNKTLTNPTVTTGSFTSPVLTTPQINDTSADHQYVFAVSELTADRTTTLPLLTGNDEFVFRDHIQTLTNKRVTKRVTTITSHATPTVNTDNCGAVTITALATAITSMTTNLSGTPTNFQTLIFRILDNATGRAITWGAKFEARGVALPTTTTASKLLTVGFVYDTVDSIWGCVAVADEA